MTADTTAPQVRNPAPIAEQPAQPLVAPPASAPDGLLPDAKKLSGPMTPADAYLKFAEETHQYVREYIRNADQKAAFFFAVTTAGIGYVLAQHVVRRWFTVTVFNVGDYASVMAILGLSAAAALFLAVVFPRLRSSSPGLIFFNEIAAHPGAIAYAEGTLATPQGELARTKLRHLYDLARVCRSKYSTLRAGFLAGTLGGFAALIYVALQEVASH